MNCKSCGAHYAGLSICEYCGRYFDSGNRKKVTLIDTSKMSKQEIASLLISYKETLIKGPGSLLALPTKGQIYNI